MKKTLMVCLMILSSLFLSSFSATALTEDQTTDYTPTLSHLGGFYNTSFLLTINPKPNTIVYYTLDGTTPTSSSNRYIAPLLIEEQWIEATGEEFVIDQHTTTIPTPLSLIRTSPLYWISPKDDIFQATILKVMAYDLTGKKKSDVLTETYFVSEKIDEYYRFLVMSIITDPKNLYDYNTGISIMGKHYDSSLDEAGHQNRTGNYFMRGDDWERPIHVELFEPTGLRVMSQDAGIRLHGGLSRKYPIKSYRLYARTEYDEQNRFEYPFFADEEITSFKRLVLRNGGQSYQYTFFGEAFAQHILKPLTLDLQNSRPVILFINGEYFGIRNIRERIDTNYLDDHYGLNERQVTILTGHAYMEDGSRSGQLHYQRLYQYATLQDLSDDRKYHNVQRWLDTDNYIDYMISQLYMGNVDWPQNNILYWRKNTSYQPSAAYGHDGRWRFIINDLDASFGISWGATTPDVNSFERLTGQNWKTGKLFTSLLKNDQFKAQFVYRMKELLETVFDETRITDELDDWVELYTPDMEKHIQRWGYPASMDTWMTYVDRMYAFADGRQAVMMETMENYLGLSEKHHVSIDFDASKGSVQILGKMDTSGHAVDHYYHDLPVTFEGVAKTGYHVAGWYYQGMLLSREAQLTLSPEEALSIELRFEEGLPEDSTHHTTILLYVLVSSLWSLTAILFLLETIRRSQKV